MSYKKTVKGEAKVRVITGSARGRRLTAPEGYEVRPTADKVKEAIFSAIQFDINDAYVLDLFAGSGQMGIEALSRGAKYGIFVDSCARSVRVINENLKVTKLDKYSEVITKDSYEYIKYTTRMFDIIILDPPFSRGHIENILPFAAKKLNGGGYIICEYETTADEPVPPEGLDIKKTYKYGNVHVTILYKRGAEGCPKNEK